MNGSAIGTPLTNTSAATSTEDLSASAQMAKLRLATDRSGNGVITSDAMSRDIQVESYSLSFHGRLLIDGASISLNYGNRWVLGRTSCSAGFSSHGERSAYDKIAHEPRSDWSLLRARGLFCCCRRSFQTS